MTTLQKHRKHIRQRKLALAFAMADNLTHRQGQFLTAYVNRIDRADRQQLKAA